MSFKIPQEVIIKKYALVSSGAYIGRYGKNCLIIAGKHFAESEDADILASALSLKNISFETEIYGVGEPTVGYIDELTEKYRYDGASAVDCVIGVGGGSVLDAAKALAGMLVNDGGVEKYLELPGMSLMQNTPLPFVAVPTTAGTGAEATKNAVIKNTEKQYKKSLRDERLMAKLVLIDASLYTGAPEETTAHSGMDALTQLIESFTSKKATPETDEYCRQGIKHIRYLATAYSDGGNIAAREETALAAFKSGVAINNSGVGAVHALASPIGAHTGLPHGLICGILLPHVMEINRDYALAKYAEAGRLLTGDSVSDDRKMADMLINAVKSLAASFKIPSSFKSERLAALAETIAKECAESASMMSNPYPFDEKFLKKFIAKVAK
ncbi:MAG: iron-containing alcohol dehydrogenase [Clostridiales bacterium]|jgi:alcohol dehydrogenase class IV|nr:iron-containing alcohol dehydrogenase [Clostridiales bacterium]